MVKQKRKVNRKKIRYFYINTELHKILRLSRGEDLVVAWNYPQSKRVAYVWSDIQKNMQHAYSISQVSQMLNRHPTIIKKYILEGQVRPVQKTYSIDERKSPGVYYMSEDNIKELHSVLLTVHIGRPRKDGAVVISNLPTKAELDAVLRQEVILYVKNKDGQFNPIWKQPDW
jgi:hypothetical protein